MQDEMIGASSDCRCIHLHHHHHHHHHRYHSNENEATCCDHTPCDEGKVVVGTTEDDDKSGEDVGRTRMIIVDASRCPFKHCACADRLMADLMEHDSTMIVGRSDEFGQTSGEEHGECGSTHDRDGKNGSWLIHPPGGPIDFRNQPGNRACDDAAHSFDKDKVQEYVESLIKQGYKQEQPFTAVEPPLPEKVQRPPSVDPCDFCKVMGSIREVQGSASKFVTICEVRKHCTVDDCWLVANGYVFDASDYVREHPGGMRSILRRAGGVADSTEDMGFHSKSGKRIWMSKRIARIIPCEIDPSSEINSCTIL